MILSTFRGIVNSGIFRNRPLVQRIVLSQIAFCGRAMRIPARHTMHDCRALRDGRKCNVSPPTFRMQYATGWYGGKNKQIIEESQMKCILLAAGYATRLYPLTVDKPKSLLEVGGITILEHILRKVEKVESIDTVYIVTNDKFYGQFSNWVASYQCPGTIKVLNDHTCSNDDRLGAVADIRFVLDAEKVDDDVLVMAGDNLFEFDLRDFVAFYRQVGHDCISTHVLNDVNELRRTGVADLDKDSRVLSFKEKPKEPRTRYAVPPFYIYQKSTLRLIGQYLDEGNNPDAPGNFIPWLITKKDVYAFKFKGMRFDIGTVESYDRVRKLYKGQSMAHS